MKHPRLFTGIQPSGFLHLGNYFGAIKNSLPLQEKYESFFCVVDLHSITVYQNSTSLKKNILEITKHYLASGINPEKSAIFVQSRISEHAELCWILNTITKIGELERMTQFKDKAKQNQENINAGLFDYPVLMAADILLYDAQVVPVGEDQKQHLELARTLAERFNKKFGKIFTIPSALIKDKEQGGRIMGLDDPTKKMSKSALSEYNYISLTDDPQTAYKKIIKATTDSGSEIIVRKDKPGISNLITIYSLIENKEIEEIEEKYKDAKGYGDFKKDLAEVIKKFLIDYQAKLSLISDSDVEQALKKGAEKTKHIAKNKLEKVKEVMGLG